MEQDTPPTSDAQSNSAQTPSSVNPHIEQSRSPTQAPNQLLYIFGAVTVVLLAIIVGLAIALSQKSTNGGLSNNSSTSTNKSVDSSKSKSVTEDLKVARTLTIDNQTDLILYEPQQTGSNTTINFSIKNTCTDCKNSRSVSAFSAISFNTTRYTKMYLLDQEAGQRYSPITDADGLPLATKSCVKSLKANEQVDCFASFAKVPSGKTVSVVLGESAPKIDGILVP